MNSLKYCNHLMTNREMSKQSLFKWLCHPMTYKIYHCAKKSKVSSFPFSIFCLYQYIYCVSLSLDRVGKKIMLSVCPYHKTIYIDLLRAFYLYLNETMICIHAFHYFSVENREMHYCHYHHQISNLCHLENLLAIVTFLCQ